MKKKIIEIDDDVGSNKISYNQTANGVWRCKELTINCMSIIDGIALSDIAIGEVEKILDIRNAKEKDDGKKQ